MNKNTKWLWLLVSLLAVVMLVTFVTFWRHWHQPSLKEEIEPEQEIISEQEEIKPEQEIISEQEEIKPEQEIISEQEEIKPEQEIISEQERYDIGGIVVKVDIEGKYLIITRDIVTPDKDKIKVNLDEKTRIFRLTAMEPLVVGGGPVTVEVNPVTMADIKVGDLISAESNQNIFGKTEIADVWKIMILPQPKR